MGWLGLLGALWAPAVLGNGDGTEHVFLVIAYTASIAVLVWRRWTVLAGFVFASATLLWAGFVADGSEALALSLYGVLAAALAFGFEANRRGVAPGRDRPGGAHAPVGLRALRPGHLRDPAGARRLVHARRRGVADRARDRPHRRRPRRHPLRADLARVRADHARDRHRAGQHRLRVDRLRPAAGDRLGPLRPPLRRAARRPPARCTTRVWPTSILGRPHAADRILALAGLASQLSLAVFQGLLFDASPTELAGPFASDGAVAAAGALAVVAWSCGRLVGPRFRTALDVLALAALAHFTGLALEGAALTVTLAAQALGLATLARHNGDRIVGWAAVAFTVTALLHALGTIAVPDALL